MQATSNLKIVRPIFFRVMKQHLSTIFGQSVKNTVLPAMESYIGFGDWNTNAFLEIINITRAKQSAPRQYRLGF
jgi:hypothetical protein